MDKILKYVQQILSIVAEILGIQRSLQDELRDVAREAGPRVIQSFVSDNYRELTDMTTGLSAAHTERGAIRDDLSTLTINVAGVAAQATTIINDIAALPTPTDYTATLAEILAAIEGLPEPPTPPTVGEISSDVWGYDDESGYSAWWRLGTAWSLAVNMDYHVALPVIGAPMFTVEGYWASLASESFTVRPIVPDWTDIGEDETILAWLIRTDTENAWEADPVRGTPRAPTYVEGDPTWDWIIRPAFTSFPARAYQPPPPVVIPPDRAAPVWPGLADATLGTSVALEDQLELVATMHGVLVNITTPPSKTGLRMIGGKPYDYNVGEIAFVSDRGDIEPWQYMGFRTAIFTPKTMQVASSALFRVLAGAVGTVRPFTVDE